MYNKTYLLIILFAIVPGAFAQNFLFDHLTVKDGLSESNVHSIYQDELDIVWIATADGLNRYDGYKTEAFRPIIGDTTGIFANNIEEVCGNRNGEVYMKCWTGLILYDTRSEKFQIIQRYNISTMNYGNNRLLVVHQNKIKFLHPETKELIEIYDPGSSLQINCIYETLDGIIYLGTQFNGLLALDKNGKISTVIADTDIRCIYEDTYKRIWAGTTSEGLYCIGDQQNIVNYKHVPVNPHSLSSNFVRSICQDDLGYIWIGTFDGLNRLNPDKKEFTCFRHSPTNNYSIGSSSVWCITKDKQGSLWIGTFFGGVDILHPELTFDQYYRPRGEKNEISGAIVSNTVEDSSGNLWICTDGAGLNYFNRETRQFTHYRHNPSQPNSLSSNTLKALYLDEENGNLWIGMHLGGLNKMDLKTRKITRITLSREDRRINNYVRGIVPLGDKLLLATHNSIQEFDPRDNSVKPFIESDDNDIKRQIWDMFIDSDNNLWFSTQSSVYKYSIKERKIQRYIEELEVTDKTITQVCFFQDSKKRIWLGSRGKGMKLYNPDTDSFVSFHTRNSGIMDDYILDIHETPLGYLLIATNKGISRFDADNQVFNNYYNNIFFPFKALNERCFFTTCKDEIGLGSLNGLLLLNERELNVGTKNCLINLTDLYVNNQRITPNSEPDILNQSILYANTVRLNHNHSVVTFEFASSNYIKALQPDIQYKLDGFDTEWVSAKRNNSSTYTNLNAGTYQFKVRAIDTFSDTILNERIITVMVAPPFYLTWYAYIFYIVGTGGLVYLIFSRIRLADSLKYAYDEKNYIEELNQSKLRFFMNISHEIRTPITLIISQLEMLMQNNEVSQSVHNKLSNIMRNAGKLRNLITELLDFRKHEQGLMVLKASEQDIIKYTEDVFLSFKEYAMYRQINTSFIHEEEEIRVWFDKSQLNKVLYNLLSNAFKFTPSKGSVSLIIEKQPKWVTVSVVDTGIGIKKEEIENLFERFYQSAHTEQGLAADTGTGIGLALVKSIVELHKGTITVLNNETKGSTFCISLPLGNSHLQPNEMCNTDINQSTINAVTIPEPEFIEEIRQTQEDISLKEASILIIEDNPDLLDVLAEIFNPIYKVHTAMNGENGLNLALSLHPDIILSDVVMPEMSGIELCKRIKSNLNICHIPVVLLTASATEEKKLEGLQIGADDYIVKPFNTKMLVMRCNNLVNNRIILQNKYKSSPRINTEQLALSQYDQSILNKAIQIVEKNFNNPEFDLNMLGQEMCMGRSSLFKKIKGLTGQTPKDFIVNIRLKKGFELLNENPDLGIADISEMVGFSDTSYFIRLFKQNFGMTPHQYRIKKREE